MKKKYAWNDPRLLDLYKQHLKDGWSSSSFVGKLKRASSDYQKIMTLPEFKAVKEEYYELKSLHSSRGYKERNAFPAPKWALDEAARLRSEKQQTRTILQWQTKRLLNEKDK